MRHHSLWTMESVVPRLPASEIGTVTRKFTLAFRALFEAVKTGEDHELECSSEVKRAAFF